MGIIESATTMVDTVTSTIVSISDATGLTSLVSGVSDKITAISEGAKTLQGVTFPLPNPLNKYASYDYILSIGVLTGEDVNNPDTTYIAGKEVPLICKSANSNPNNRITTAYGKFDFFIDNLVIDSVISHQNNNNTNVTMMSFDIIEPYSMGLLATACQKASEDCGWNSWREAVYLMTIEFRGNTETGQMVKVPGTTRYIPFRWANMSMTVGPEGAKYTCMASIFNQENLSDRVAKLKNDTSISGSTVQEVLQTGEKSLQAVINMRLQQFKRDGLIQEPDEVLIIFPKNISSDPSTSSIPPSSEDNAGAVTREIDTANPTVLTQLGVARSSVNNTLIQAAAECNDMGKASMGFGKDRKGDAPFGKEDTIWDPVQNVWIRTNNIAKITESDFRFSQDTDIINAINQVLLQSEFPTKALSSERKTEEGYRQWWKIDVQTYIVSSNANMKTTGTKPKLYVYRVIPYLVHVSSGPLPPNSKPPYTKLIDQVVKHYNYIYTGKNSDIITFQIHYESTFNVLMSADAAKQSIDVRNANATSSSIEKRVNTIKMTGNEPEKSVAPIPVSYSAISSSSDRLGGGGNETANTRAARLFHDTINNSNVDMATLEMTIIGDPYYIAQSGTGNYTSTPSQYSNLNADGTVNYQNGEVDILVHFRTPLDINQKTGMMDFGGQTKSSPVMEYSGYYRVTTLTSTFKDGKFTQVLQGVRRLMQELTNESSSLTEFNSSSMVEEPTNGSVSTSLSGLTNAIGGFLDTAVTTNVTPSYDVGNAIQTTMTQVK